jgi:hypothetical protein
LEIGNYPSRLLLWRRTKTNNKMPDEECKRDVLIIPIQKLPKSDWYIY